MVDEALNRGWELVRQGRHVVMRWPPTNRRLTLPTTPSDWRSARNALAVMRRLEAEEPVVQIEGR